MAVEGIGTEFIMLGMGFLVLVIMIIVVYFLMKKKKDEYKNVYDRYKT